MATTPNDDVKHATSPKQIGVTALAFGAPMGLLFWFQTRALAPALVAGLVSGLLFSLAMAFVASRAGGEGKSAKAWFGDVDPLAEGEQVLRSGLANHFKGVEGVGGRLFLTDRRLRFVSHKLNVQRHDESYPLDEIEAVEATRTLGIIPNGMRVTLRSGRQERFVLYQRAAWVEALRAALPS